MKKISVCVPTYNRPETLRQLIYSFLRQDYKNKELIISDDSSNESIKDLVQEFTNQNIKYFKNNPPLQFSKNFLASLLHATGDYIVTIGDDDIFLTTNALSRYVQVFDENKSVNYVYSNLVQFSNSQNIEYIVNHFSKDKLFHKGEDAMRNIWTTSIFIGGIGIRNNMNLKNMYPEKNILHPQVELVGNIINQFDSYGIAEHLIGVRSHEEQIIFRALKDKAVRQDGEHVTIELFKIFETLRQKYSIKYDNEFLSQQLISGYMVMIFKEKGILGVKSMRENYRKFNKISSVAAKSKKLKSAYILSNVMPSFSIRYLRDFAIKTLSIVNRKEFMRYKKKLIVMSTAL